MNILQLEQHENCSYVNVTCPIIRFMYPTPTLVLGDNVSIEIKIISVLFSRYDNYDDNYMKGVHEHTKKSVH